jgi:hypothetical protein
MKIITETDLTDFECWSGAEYFFNKLTYQELKTISLELEQLYPEGVSETFINDLFWFEQEFICQTIGEDLEEILERV